MSLNESNLFKGNEKFVPILAELFRKETPLCVDRYRKRLGLDFRLFKKRKSEAERELTIRELLFDFENPKPKQPLPQPVVTPVFSLEEEEESEIVDMDIASDNESVVVHEDSGTAVKNALDQLDFELDESFKKVLKPHQIEGLKFMWDKVFLDKQGCLLSHSMGLGKSVQTIALLVTIFQYLKKDPTLRYPTGKRVLILAPLITLSNWVNEFQKWGVDGMDNILGDIYNFSEGVEGYRGRIQYIKHWYREGGVLLISYDQYRILLTNPKLNDLDRTDYRQMLIEPGPDLVILDEGHRIKNATANITHLISQIRTRARICLTGYPLQNNLMEYYHMLQFIAPHLLGDPSNFKTYFKNEIDQCYSDSSRLKKERSAIRMYTLQLLSSHVTHRKDESILKQDLPEKYEYRVRFRLSAVQHEGYCRLLRYAQESESPLVGLIGLRALCNHPRILETLLINRNKKSLNRALDQEYGTTHLDDNFYTDETERDIQHSSVEAIDRLDEEDMIEKFSITVYNLMKDFLEREDTQPWMCSGKMAFIADLAQYCKILKEKLVIVSHSVVCLEYIQQLLPIFGIHTIKIDGSTAGTSRQKLVDTFQTDESMGVILLSAKAAAIGINLTAANRIVLVDQDWNPLYDEQSIGRVYRYGQTKAVHVYRLITASTIEERIFAQSVHKKAVARRVVDNKITIGISKEELTKYYATPSNELKSIKVDHMDPNLKKDYITYSALLQNKEFITECKVHDTSYKEDDPMDTLVNRLSESDRSTAKLDAFELFKAWKQKSTLPIQHSN